MPRDNKGQGKNNKKDHHHSNNTAGWKNKHHDPEEDFSGGEVWEDAGGFGGGGGEMMMGIPAGGMGQPPCPCVSLISRDHLKTLLVESEKKNFFICPECVQEAEENLRNSSSGKGGRQGKKDAKANAGNSKKGGGGGKTGKGGKHGKGGGEEQQQGGGFFSSQFVCMTCLYVGCDKHAPNHYFNANRKGTGKKKSGDRGQHCLMLDFNASDASTRNFSFVCHHCNVTCGCAPSPSPYDANPPETARWVDGIPVTEEGFVIDEDGTADMSLAAEKIGQMVSNALGGVFPHTDQSRNRGGDEEEGKARKGRRKKGEQGESKEEKGRRVEVLQRAGVMGLFNLGNTCFYNSTLQCILQCASFISGLKAMDQRERMPGAMTAALVGTALKYGDYSGGHVFVPKTLFSAVCGRNCMFAEYGQQDAQELFNCIMNGSSDEYKARKLPASKCAVDQSFGGEMLQAIVCHECQSTSRLKTKFYDISVSLSARGGTNSLQQCIRGFFDPVLLTGETAFVCEKCCQSAFEEKRRREAEEQARRETELAQQAAVDLEAIMKADQAVDDEDDGVSEASEDEEEPKDEEEKEEERDDAAGPSESHTAASSRSTPPPSTAIPTEQNGSIRVTLRASSSPTGGEVVSVVSNSETGSPTTTSSPTVNLDPVASSTASAKSESVVKTVPAVKSPTSTATAASTTTTTSSPTAGSTATTGQKPKTVKVDATMNLTINKLNPVLVIHIKRFNFNMRNLSWDKINTPVDIPTQIDLSDFFTPGESPMAETLGRFGGGSEDDSGIRSKKSAAVSASPSPAAAIPEVDLGMLPEVFPRVPREIIANIVEIAGGDLGMASMMLQEGAAGMENSGGSSGGMSSSTKGGAHEEGAAYSGGPPTQYVLTGVVEHVGTANHGHYVSYVRSAKADMESGKPAVTGKGDWYLCNDSHASRATIDEALNAQPYLLFYELR